MESVGCDSGRRITELFGVSGNTTCDIIKAIADTKHHLGAQACRDCAIQAEGQSVVVTGHILVGDCREIASQVGASNPVRDRFVSGTKEKDSTLHTATVFDLQAKDLTTICVVEHDNACVGTTFHNHDTARLNVGGALERSISIEASCSATNTTHRDTFIDIEATCFTITLEAKWA